ncbi:MAG: D-glycero-beta-D-manno-heptose 1,7-bisphosphate 7-phosphatase [Pseudomonadales bacterium]|nr:D-glycero-beta-D-manno-heptose 1,7-bisphosphate 7-phosphatase [Pseudomonadales bacterium]
MPDTHGKLVILDRDGVINHDSPDYIKSPDEWIPISGSIEAIARLSQAGYRIYLATNQAGVGRGLFSEETLHDIHDKLEQAVENAGGRIEAIFYCPHHPDDGCGCRKPAPGMLMDIAEHAGVDIRGQVYVGDSMKDIEAARAAGCKPVLVLTGNGAHTQRVLHGDVDIYDDLAAFAEHLS